MKDILGKKNRTITNEKGPDSLGLENLCQPYKFLTYFLIFLSDFPYSFVYVFQWVSVNFIL